MDHISFVAGWRTLDSSWDADHNRLVLSLAGSSAGLSEAVFAAVAAGVAGIDLRRHSGVHPRRGAADVVPFVPLGGASMEEAVSLARAVGSRIWSELGVPVHFYGEASAGPTPLTLASIRSSSPPAFDLGSTPHPTAGSVAVGARPPLVAYNLLLNGVALDSARRVAASLRESSPSGAGVPGIQALAFPIAAGASVQLSMNLTRLEVTTPARARAEAEARLPAGGSVAAEEVVGLCPALAAVGCTAADGRLLEARLAAAAARIGAASALEIGGEEMRKLSERLSAEAGSLGAIGTAELLAGAERAAALRRVLQAGKVLSAETDALLEVAARGLFDALPGPVRAAYPDRVAALEPRLGPIPPA